MTRLSTPFHPIPTDTAHAVEAVFGKGNVYRAVGDQVNHLFVDINLAHLGASDENPPSFLASLALITIFQYMEDLPDHRAAEAVCTRMDWKYALHLPLNSLGFDHQALCQFRHSILLSVPGSQTFQLLLNRLALAGLLGNMDKQRANVPDLLSRVCTISRLEQVTETIYLALETLATYHPELLREIASPHWYERYGSRHTFLQVPATRTEQTKLAQRIGDDARYLLEMTANRQEAGLELLPEMRNLQQKLSMNFVNQAGTTQWRLWCASCEQSLLQQHTYR